MNSTPPPPRYRIVEKGRRLVTVDMKTGQEIGLAANVPGKDPVFGASAAQPVRPATMNTTMTAPVPRAPAPRAPAQAVPGTVQPSPWGERDTLDEDMRQIAQTLGVKASAMRWAVLMGGAILAIFVLIITQMWIVPTALMLFPLTRGWTFEALKKAFARVVAWANAG